MITCNLMGGLGNQLFQIFATISYAIKSGNQFKFLSVKELGSGNTTVRYTFWDTFFSNLKPFLINEITEHLHFIKEKEFSFNELPIYEMINRNVMIYGYFQSYKYFMENYNIICRIIGLEKMKQQLINNYQLYETELEKNISIHFRLGDYKKVQDFHPLATYTFYENALEYIKNVYPDITFTILFFCEEEDIEEVMITIGKLANKNSNFRFIRGEKCLSDWEQMLLMSLCHHNIIANSSFSWWSAYFNSNNDKIVCYPSVWFGECAQINTTDLCPPDWIKIDV